MTTGDGRRETGDKRAFSYYSSAGLVGVWMNVPGSPKSMSAESK